MEEKDLRPMIWILWLIVLGIFAGCEDAPLPVVAGSDGDSDSDTDGDSDGDTDGDSDSDADGDWAEFDTEDCDNLLEITVRDFDETHPDMQRADSGWGPLAGVLELTLGADRKPVFYDAMGTHTWKTGLEDGILEKNCWDSGPRHRRAVLFRYDSHVRRGRRFLRLVP